MAQAMAKHLSGIEAIRNIPVRVDIRKFSELPQVPMAGIFLAEKPQRLDFLLSYGKSKQAILFSPFSGDVEKGVPAGMIISDRILPYINPDSIREFGIQIKPLFLRITVVFEP